MKNEGHNRKVNRIKSHSNFTTTVKCLEIFLSYNTRERTVGEEGRSEAIWEGPGMSHMAQNVRIAVEKEEIFV